MMKSLLNSTDHQEFIDRINKLTHETPRQWGKMNVSQMLAHSAEPFKSAVGELKLKRAFIGYIFGPIAKKKLVNEKPFEKNLPTYPGFIKNGEHDFETEKTNLLSYINRYHQAGRNGISVHPHPFFGHLTPEEWDMLMSKHTDHHLRQFGV